MAAGPWQTPILGTAEEIDDTPTLSFDADVGPGYFTVIRSSFLRNHGLSAEAKTLYILLLSYCGSGTTAFPGQKRLCWELNLSEPTLRKLFAELESLHLVGIKRRGQGRTNIYHVHKIPSLFHNQEYEPPTGSFRT